MVAGKDPETLVESFDDGLISGFAGDVFAFARTFAQVVEFVVIESVIDELPISGRDAALNAVELVAVVLRLVSCIKGTSENLAHRPESTALACHRYGEWRFPEVP